MTPPLKRSPTRQLYTPPDGYEDFPFTYVFDGTGLVDGSDALNQYVYIQGGWGDFIMRRCVGLATVVNPTAGGSFLLKDSQNRPLSSDPIVIGSVNDDLMFPNELYYRETSKIGFDLHNVLRDPPPVAFRQTQVITQPLSVNQANDFSIGLSAGPNGLFACADQDIAGVSYCKVFKTNEATGIAVLGETISKHDDAYNDGQSYASATCFTPDGNWLFIGNPRPDISTDRNGYVDVYKLTGGLYVFNQTITIAGTLTANLFGGSLACPSSTEVLVGCPQYDNQGAVIYFTLVAGVWTQQQIITGSIFGNQYAFGSSVQTSPTQCVIAQFNQGLSIWNVYLFTNILGTWTQEQLIQAVGSDFFDSVAMSPSGNLVAITGYNQPGLFSFADVYLQTAPNTWTFQQRITQAWPVPSGNPNDAFGPVIIDDNGNLFIAAPGTPSSFSTLWNDGPGSVFVYQNAGSGYQLLQQINGPASPLAHPNLPVAGFGFSIAFDGTMLYIGSFTDQQVNAVSLFMAKISFVSQIAFQGVRRLPRISSTKDDSCDFDERTFTYGGGNDTDLQGIISAPGPADSPSLTLVKTINDYDFDLYQLIITYQAGVQLPPFVCSVNIYDYAKNRISNIPVLDAFYNGAQGSMYKNGAFVPPLKYKQNTQFKIEFFSLSSVSPITVTVHLVGRQRIPKGVLRAS